MANGEAFKGIFGGLAQGFTSGFRTGLLSREIRGREEERRREDTRRETEQKLATSVGKIGLALKLLDNKNLPKEVKLKIFNSTLVPEFNAINTRPGTEVNKENLLGTLDEFPDGLQDLIKQANKVFTDKTLNTQQKIDALAVIQVEAGKDPRFAPFLDRLKENKKTQQAQDQLRALELLQSGGGISEDEASEFGIIVRRSPTAVIEAQKVIQASRDKEQPKKLDAFTDKEGNRILVLQAAGKREEVNLGKTREQTGFNLGEFRANLSIRSRGLTTGNAKIDSFKPVVAKAIFDDLNKTDFLTQLLTGAFGGNAGQTSPPKGKIPETTELPDTVTTTSQAIEFLKNQFGATDDEAITFLRAHTSAK